MGTKKSSNSFDISLFPDDRQFGGTPKQILDNDQIDIESKDVFSNKDIKALEKTDNVLKQADPDDNFSPGNLNININEDTTSEQLILNRKISGLSKLAAAGIEILNANVEFDGVESLNAANIQVLQGQQKEIIDLGKQAAFKEETKGFVRGELSTLSAAARGQSVSGGLAQSAQLAEETFGIVSAMSIETDAIREALGLAKQAVLIDHETNIARINRNLDVASSALSGLISGATTFI